MGPIVKSKVASKTSFEQSLEGEQHFPPLVYKIPIRFNKTFKEDKEELAKEDKKSGAPLKETV